MTQEEYKKALAEIDAEAERQKEILAINYANENNPYKVGDIIEDILGKGRIIEMGAFISRKCAYPMMRYKCENLTKKGTINKNVPMRIIFQINIIEQ